MTGMIGMNGGGWIFYGSGGGGGGLIKFGVELDHLAIELLPLCTELPTCDVAGCIQKGIWFGAIVSFGLVMEPRSLRAVGFDSIIPPVLLPTWDQGIVGLT